MQHEQQHPMSRRWAVVEDDGQSAWLYLTEPHEPRPIADCWLYNRVPAPHPSELSRFRGGPPPAAIGFVDGAALYRESPDVECRWSPDGESVAAAVDGLAIGCIVGASRPGYSRHLVRSGPWGEPWNEAVYASAFP